MSKSKSKYYNNGFLYGRNCSDAIMENIKVFLQTVQVYGLTEKTIQMMADKERICLSKERLDEIRGIAQGTKISEELILCYNLYHSALLPEGCTVFFAAGTSSATGYTIIGKNSDKGGSEKLVGDNYYKNREINVVSYFENEDGSHIVGISAAGSTGLKMGMNSYGVAAATNYGYTSAAANRPLSIKDTFAGDRAQVIRDALKCSTALEAAQTAVAVLMKKAMATSGMVEFADGKEVFIVESTYDCLAVKKIVDDVDSRSNYFVTLDKLNEEGNASCYCRYHRSQTMLHEIAGKVTVEDLKRISMDHHDGYGSTGICRHTANLESSTLASAIMEINGCSPEKSKIHIALGKPCNAWRMEDGHITISMDMKREEIPIEFLQGIPFNKYCLSEPIDFTAK